MDNVTSPSIDTAEPLTNQMPKLSAWSETMMIKFWCELRNWSQEVFGPTSSRGPGGCLKHLEKEAREAYLEIDQEKLEVEIADCLFLVFDAAQRSGMSFTDLVRQCQKKLVVNKARKWPKPTSDEPVEHVKKLQEEIETKNE